MPPTRQQGEVTHRVIQLKGEVHGSVYTELWCVSLESGSPPSTPTNSGTAPPSGSHCVPEFREAPQAGKAPGLAIPFPFLLVTVALWLLALGLLIVGVFFSAVHLPRRPHPLVPRLHNSSHIEELPQGSLVRYVSTKFKAPATDQQKIDFYSHPSDQTTSPQQEDAGS
jgi:hypothetical protein